MADSHNQPQPLGKRICELRARLGLTQQQLAAGAGVNEDTLKSIEQGRRGDPRLSSVSRIAAALGMSLDELVAASEPPASLD